MKKQELDSIKIGDKLWTGGTLFCLEYEVIEIRQTKESQHYVVECVNCSDHKRCRVLITRDQMSGEEQYRYVEMLNNYYDSDDYEDDEESNVYQTFVHFNEIFYKNKNSGTLYRMRKNLDDIKEEEVKLIKNLDSIRERKIHIENYIKDLELIFKKD